jgi:hypothetical protein
VEPREEEEEEDGNNVNINNINPKRFLARGQVLDKYALIATSENSPGA